MARARTPVGVGGRRLGKFESFTQNPATGDVTAVFQGGVLRTYSQGEIADYVVQVAKQTIDDPGSLDEAWYEFLRTVVGEENMVETIAMVSALGGPEDLPAALRVVTSDGKRQH